MQYSKMTQTHTHTHTHTNTHTHTHTKKKIIINVQNLNYVQATKHVQISSRPRLSFRKDPISQKPQKLEGETVEVNFKLRLKKEISIKDRP